MATLIICPACGTRYETQAVFPPEGRKVRCSKCAHVWQALPVTAPPAPAMKPAAKPAPQPAAAPKAPPPPPPPQPAAAPVNMAMRGFAGISQPTPQPAPSTAPPPPPIPDVMAQVARINEEAMGEAEPPQPEKRGGIFARLARKAAPTPLAPDSTTDAAMSGAGAGNGAMPGGIGDASMFDAGMTDTGMSDASMGDASMDAGLGDADMGIDPALAAQAFPDEHPSTRRLSPVALGWLVLALVLAGIVGTLALAPAAVVSVLPGATRLYALFGVDTGGQGLAFEGVRYGWASEGGQTVLEVQGDVVNTSSAPVDVPTVVIALRDANGAEISQWTTEIGEDQLAAGEHAPFLRQIPAPPSNVRSVKVGFAQAE